MTICWKAVEQYFTIVLFFFFDFNQFVILENLTIILDLVLSGVKSITQFHIWFKIWGIHHSDPCTVASLVLWKF